ncbi:MAG: type II toxin-antitoxin system HipA family toxin [Gammaproteobacteria bacterium]|nr:type II toxin-antitoxin system HipA family toxin [Gammaproteobacteria bacterium]
MTFQPINLINVSYYRGNSPLLMGRLALKDRKIYFEYAPSFIELGLELSPIKLPLKPGIIACNDYIFDGLFGVFNDSLPDGWGRLLLDRKLIKTGINPNKLSALDRLMHVGKNGMGALYYEPALEDNIKTINLENLDTIADECLCFEESDDEFIDELLAMNGSSAGARPKLLINLIPQKNDLQITKNNFKNPHDDWIIKFRSSLDPKDIGAIEYAYHLMALEAKLEVPEARLFKSKKCEGYFGVKRFDHIDSGFVHMHTLSGLLHTDHRIPAFDYKTLLEVTLFLTKNIQECEKQFRHATFNVLAHNRDDHTKNFSFLMDSDGIWKVSPTYDLTYSSGPAGEHCTTVMGEGKNPGIKYLLQLASAVNIKEKNAKKIIDEVRQAILKWPKLAEKARVGIRSLKNIQSNLNKA